MYWGFTSEKIWWEEEGKAQQPLVNKLCATADEESWLVWALKSKYFLRNVAVHQIITYSASFKMMVPTKERCQASNKDCSNYQQEWSLGRPLLGNQQKAALIFFHPSKKTHKKLFCHRCTFNIILLCLFQKTKREKEIKLFSVQNSWKRTKPAECELVYFVLCVNASVLNWISYRCAKIRFLSSCLRFKRTHFWIM